MSPEDNGLRALLNLAQPGSVDFAVGEPEEATDFLRTTIRYAGAEGDTITAFYFRPKSREPRGGVVVFHQHNGEFHLGKSEVAGLSGDPLQAFGPALAVRGVAVLAPDAITFEDRRTGAEGIAPDDNDWLQHYNALAYRMVNGDILMRKCLDDAQRAFSVLSGLSGINPERLGTFGHSYGGSTALYHAAVDPRPQFVGVSGAAASLRERQSRGIGINMFEVVPGLAQTVDAPDLVRLIAPRPLLVVSATEDPYSIDADAVVASAGSEPVTEFRVEGEHALDRGRFETILDWLVEQTQRAD